MQRRGGLFPPHDSISSNNVARWQCSSEEDEKLRRGFWKAASSGTQVRIFPSERMYRMDTRSSSWNTLSLSPTCMFGTTT
jgi:hypothetical protein